MSRVSIVLAATLTAVGMAQAQDTPASSYAGMEHRSVKAFSDQQIAALRAGDGMGLAL